jgi:hypothetical protein
MPHLDIPQSHCQGAIARRDITPPVGMYHRMWGAATHDRSTGIHRPLLATALALRSPHKSAGHGTLQVLVSLDHCLLWTDEMDALRSAVCRSAWVAPESLHITFSHTHAAGLLDPARADLPGGDLIASYLDMVAQRVASAAREAIDALRPVWIVYGRGRCDLAAHRDYWDAENRLFVCGFNPSEAADDTVLVARITDEQSRCLGTIVNYACHPTTLAWDNTLVSPDFVGALRETVEAATGAPCLFLQGASGELGPRHGYVGDVTAADRNGRQLGYAALAALEPLPAPGVRFEYTGPVVSGATIGTWAYAPLPKDELPGQSRWRCEQFTVDLPYRADLPTRDATEAELASWQAAEESANRAGDREQARDCRAQIERMNRQLARLRSLPEGTCVPLSVSLWQLGGALWLMLEAEHYSLLQRALRERFPDCPIIVVTMTNGWRPGYVPTAETFGKGIYQESIAVVAPGSLEQLIEQIGTRIAAWRTAG